MPMGVILCQGGADDVPVRRRPMTGMNVVHSDKNGERPKQPSIEEIHTMDTAEEEEEGML